MKQFFNYKYLILFILVIGISHNAKLVKDKSYVYKPSLILTIDKLEENMEKYSRKEDKYSRKIEKIDSEISYIRGLYLASIVLIGGIGILRNQGKNKTL